MLSIKFNDCTSDRFDCMNEHKIGLYSGFPHNIFDTVNFYKPIFSVCLFVSSLPDNKIIDSSKLKAFADNNFNVVQMMGIVFDTWVDKNVGKGGKAGY